MLYKNKLLNNEYIEKYNKTDINFNKIFRYYILEYLSIKLTFCNYNPRIYRDKDNIIRVS